MAASSTLTASTSGATRSMIKSRIGVLPEGLRLFERLSGRELLSYNGQLRGIPRAEVEQRAEEC